MTVVGGRRSRLIHDSVYQMVRLALEDLGWFDSNRRHAPVSIRPRPVPFDEEVPFNTIAIASTDVADEEDEIGSNLATDTWTYYVDLYAEDDSLGTHLIHDIRDILRGKIPSIGRSAPIVPIYDYAMATPPLLFYCQIERVIVDRAVDFPKPWQRYWYVVRFDLLDAFGDSDDD